MNNVHRLVVPARDETRATPAGTVRRMGEVLILPCVRYERIEAPGSRRTHAAASAHDPVRQDLTA